MSVQHFVNVSGGKDSTACVLLMQERLDRLGSGNMPPRYLFCDTGNEDAITLEYVAYLGDALGITIETIRADFSDWMAERRAALPDVWSKEHRQRKHVSGCDRKRGCDCPIIVSPPVPDHLIRRAVEALQPTGNPFLDLCMIKGRFPSRKAQFCTEELKVIPANAVQDELLDAGVSVVNWLGERADESLNRAKKPPIQRILMRPGSRVSRVLYRPIHKWTAADTFEIARRHGIKPNPLYSMGMGRVGCMPCINCRKDELAQIARRFPQHIDRIREWETIVALVARRGHGTFFPISISAIGDPKWEGASIDDAVEWSRTSRGGRNFDIFNAIADHSPTMCESAYGLCE